MIAITVTDGWEINSLDIKSAFLQGKEISRALFVKPLKEAKTDNLWKLLKTVYGLNDTSRMWYLHIRDEFIICGACVVLANMMKPYLIGITRTHSKVLYAVTWMTSFGEDHKFSRIKLYVRSSRISKLVIKKEQLSHTWVFR